MKIAAAHAIAGYIPHPRSNRILPNILDKNVTKNVAAAVTKAAIRCGCSRSID
jgi:malic enzyme